MIFSLRTNPNKYLAGWCTAEIYGDAVICNEIYRNNYLSYVVVKLVWFDDGYAIERYRPATNSFGAGRAPINYSHQIGLREAYPVVPGSPI
jgi:hypothetical protein